MAHSAPHDRKRDAPLDGRSGAEEQGVMRPFSQAIPMKFLRAREAVISRFRPILHSHQITEQQWRILRVLADLRETEILSLSEWCLIHPASLSRILPKMDAAGLINRRTNDADKRRVIVSLADKGRALVEEMGAETEAAFGELIAEIGEERLERLNNALDDIIAILSGPDRSRPS
ncbi:homoprotocatechuate degradation operon regulator HpaR [Microbaculum sp. FT89]|uniref:homoprotocatechuate degradation operon regulator HpaR n=1 Tax=Microbaculum sp. FT89 TaxID=3447298 RepID=UPI003F53446A